MRAGSTGESALCAVSATDLVVRTDAGQWRLTWRRLAVTTWPPLVIYHTVLTTPSFLSVCLPCRLSGTVRVCVCVCEWNWSSASNAVQQCDRSSKWRLAVKRLIYVLTGLQVGRPPIRSSGITTNALRHLYRDGWCVDAEASTVCVRRTSPVDDCEMYSVKNQADDDECMQSLIVVLLGALSSIA